MCYSERDRRRPALDGAISITDEGAGAAMFARSVVESRG